MDISKMKREASKRLAMICGARPDIVDGFQCHGEIPVFFPPNGLCRTANDMERQHVVEFQEQHGAIVYAVLAARWAIGLQDAFLYVDRNEWHWAFERSALCHEGRAHAFIDVYENRNYNECTTIRFVRAEDGPVWVFP